NASSAESQLDTPATTAPANSNTRSDFSIRATCARNAQRQGQSPMGGGGGSIVWRSVSEVRRRVGAAGGRAGAAGVRIVVVLLLGAGGRGGRRRGRRGRVGGRGGRRSGRLLLGRPVGRRQLGRGGGRRGVGGRRRLLLPGGAAHRARRRVIRPRGLLAHQLFALAGVVVAVDGRREPERGDAQSQGNRRSLVGDVVLARNVEGRNHVGADEDGVDDGRGAVGCAVRDVPAVGLVRRRDEQVRTAGRGDDCREKQREQRCTRKLGNQSHGNSVS